MTAAAQPRAVVPRRWRCVSWTLILLFCASLGGGLTSAGCMPPPEGELGQGEGPGKRRQELALTPEEELQLGREAYREILSKSRVVRRGREVDRVREVGSRIIKAAAIEPLQREINLNVQDYRFEWEFNVLEDRQINAFCLPAGKIGVYTGLLRVATTDDQLATVMAHEIAHALAHHASERLARRQLLPRARLAAEKGMDSLETDQRQLLLGLLADGNSLSDLAQARMQETEADHIGIFLMTFADYDPREAVTFWRRMDRATPEGGMPEIMSDHPSDARRIAMMEMWVPHALGAKKAFDEGRIAPRAR